MRIRALKKYTYIAKGEKHSYTMTPEMGIIKHFPSRVCEAAIKAGAAEEVKSSRKRDNPATAD